nr:hypothetical protein [Tanacetum cinerariifolium]
MRNIDPRGNKQQLMMPYPCTTWLNHIEHKVEEVQFYGFKYEIDLSYTKWDKHGEKEEQETTAQIPVNATIEFVDDIDFDMDFDTEKPLHKGCPDFTKLSAIVKLLNLKGYKKIHVCSNNCLLYWKDNKELTVFPTYGISRWKVDNKTHKVYEKILAKVMWYFPIIPRLQRLFKLESISKDLRWHATRRITNGVLCHLTDSQAWRTIDEKLPEIAKYPRYLRLGISADGVEVNSRTRHHSVWPVLSVIYNLPSWLCMKRKFIMLLTGVDTYDTSTNENFNLHSVVLWTINDYPALGTLCGYPYSGFKELGIKPELFSRKEKDTTTLPPAGYTLTNAKKDIFYETLSNISVPQGYCSNFFSLMYPFERCMKIIKGHVRNINRPEGCIAEETIKKETIKFFSKYHKTMKTIGIPPDKHVTNKNEDEKPLSIDKSSEVSGEVFQKAHLCVIHNTDEIVPYIKRHKQVLKTKNPGKQIALLENEHSKSFAKWLHEEVKRELAISKYSVSETVRWISYVPRATILKYKAYNINGYTFRIKSNDDIVYQNSGVSVEAVDLHISKEVATTRKAFYYGVL